jgi:hypothetical protein
MSNELDLDPYLQRMVQAGMDGADILHGHLKSLMFEAENSMLTRNKDEHKKYWAGKLDAYTELYNLTYSIAFAKGDN